MSGKELPRLVSHALTPREAKLSLDQLTAKYPPPVMREGT